MSKLGRFTLLAAAAIAAATAVSPAWAQESGEPIPARLRYFEGTVTVQRAHAGETTDGLVNLPIDAGDRLWTDASGRAEIVFDDGTVLWLDRQSTLDVVALPRADSAGEVLLRLWSGALIAERDRDYTVAALRIDSADAMTELRGAGTFRVELDDEHRLWVSVYDGEAAVTAGGAIELLTAGTQSWVEAGYAPAQAVTFNTADADDFTNWQSGRWVAYAETERHVQQRSYVPARVRPYAADLEASGTWFYHDDFDAWAWRPVVATSWAPYRHGRWVYSYGGWSWVSYSSWGWATSHYGRWHHLPAHGWVWFPGRVYRPAWVSWYVGGGYLGWCPIGYYNRPFLSINLFFGGRYGYGQGYHGNYRYDYPPARGSFGGSVVAGKGYARPRDVDNGWTFSQVAGFGKGDGSQRTFSRTAIPRPTSQGAVSLDGTLRPRNPSTLASLAKPRGDGAISSISVGRGSTRPQATGKDGSRSGIGAQARPRPGGVTSSSGSRVQVRPRPDPGSGVRRPPSSGGSSIGSGAKPRPGVSRRPPSSGGSSIGSGAKPGGSARRPPATGGSTARPRDDAKPGSGSIGTARRPSVSPRAPSRPSVSSRAPSRPSISSRTPSRPSISSRAPSRPSVSSRPSRPAPRPQPRASGGSRAKPRPKSKPKPRKPNGD